MAVDREHFRGGIFVGALMSGRLNSTPDPTFVGIGIESCTRPDGLASNRGIPDKDAAIGLRVRGTCLINGSSWRTTMDGERSLVRPAGVDDAYAIAATLDDWAVAQWLSLPYPVTMEDVRRLIVAPLPIADEDPGVAGTFAIIDKDDDTVAGGLMVEHKADGTAWIRYWLKATSWGKGLATDAVRTGVRWAFVWGADSVHALIDPDNLRSARVLEQTGFRLVEVRDRKRPNHRGAHVALVYMCTPADAC